MIAPTTQSLDDEKEMIMKKQWEEFVDKCKQVADTAKKQIDVWVAKLKK